MTKEETEDLYEEVAKEWGSEAQLGMAQEECAELIQAISKFNRGKRYGNLGMGQIEHLAEEIADVQIMCEQIILMFGLQTDVQATRSRKLRRLKQRLEDYKSSKPCTP